MSQQRRQQFKFGLDAGQRDLTQPDLVNAADHIALITRLEDESRARSNLHRRNASKIEKILNNLEAELRQKVGESVLTKYRRYLYERTNSSHGLNLSGIDKDSLNRLSLAKEETRNKSLSILKESSVDVDKLKQMYKEYGESIRRLLKIEDNPLKLEFCEFIEESKVPKNVLEATESNTPITKKAPYDFGWDKGLTWYGYHFDEPFTLHFLNRETGKLGHKIHTSTRWEDPFGFSAEVRIDMNDSVGFYKNISKTGKWHVFVNLERRKSVSTYTFFNQPWDSYVSCDMWSQLYFAGENFPSVNLAAENPYSVFTLHHSYFRGDDWEGVYPVSSTFSGWIHFKTGEKITAKSPTYISTGIYHDIDAYLVNYWADLDFEDRWVIKQVSIEVE